MPTVPVQQMPSIGRRPVPDIQAPIDIFGGARAVPDVSGLAEQATALWQEEQRKANEVAQTNFGSQLSSLETRLALATRQRHGADAFTAPADVAKEWTAQTAKIENGLTNDTQKIAFGRMKAMHQAALDETVQSHIATERERFDVEQTNAYVTNERTAGLVSGDPGRLSLSIDNQRIALAKYLTRVGAPPELVKQATDEAASTTHVEYLTQLLDSPRPGDAQLAQAYFAKHQGEIAPSKVGPIERMLATRSVEGEAQKQSDQILATALDPEAAMKAAALIQEPNVRKETESRLRQAYADQAAFQRQKADKALRDASKIVEDTKGDYSKVPLSVREQLSPYENFELQRRADELRHPKATTNQDVKSTLLNAAGLHPDEFTRLDLTQYKDQLSPADYTSIQNKQLTMRLGEVSRQRVEARRSAAEALKAKKEADKKKAAEDFLKANGLQVSPKVPGGPLPVRPAPGAVPAPAKPAPHPAIQQLPIPEEWKDESAVNPDYEEYLLHHGDL